MSVRAPMRSRSIALLLACLGFAGPPSLAHAGDAAGDARAAPAAACGRHAAAAPALARLRDALQNGRFVAFGPTSLQVHDGRVTPADPVSLRKDLEVLRPRFDSLVTYGARNGAEAIPGIAAELGFRAMIVGVWDPFDAREVDAALEAARRFPQLVVGISLGNELVFAKRRRLEELPALVDRIRARAPAVALATTEPFHVFFDAPAHALLQRLDFVLLNVHPVFQPWWRDTPDANGAQFVTNVVAETRARFCGPVLVKETGVPTAPAAAGYTEARQASFYRALRERFVGSRDAAFAYFAAYDAPWRVADEQAVPGHHPEEAHWGLYEEDRRPKLAARELPVLAVE